MRGVIACVIVCIVLVEFAGCMDRGCAVNSAGATKEKKKDEGTFGNHLSNRCDVGSDRRSSVAAGHSR